MNRSQVTSVSGDLRGVATARELCQATIANMKQNPGFTFVYNSFGVPLVAGLLFPLYTLAVVTHDCCFGDESRFSMGHRQRTALTLSRLISRLVLRHRGIGTQ